MGGGGRETSEGDKCEGGISHLLSTCQYKLCLLKQECMCLLLIRKTKRMQRLVGDPREESVHHGTDVYHVAGDWGGGGEGTAPSCHLMGPRATEKCAEDLRVRAGL